ncbi:hypothetical protein GCM10008967_32420 [Bacillus carboniphilus]|uniref:Lipoprotein n=1 Tax=Bacillus carboniphilus TaxID=86663 RepID=A0ABP3G9A2_9BACI
MKKWQLFCFITITTIIFTACNHDSQKDNDKTGDLVVDEFEKAGIPLGEKKVKSRTFDFEGSDEKNYGFSGGTLYLIYNYSDKEKIVDEVRRVLAESEFSYPLKTLYTNEFCLIFAPSNNNSEINRKWM